MISISAANGLVNSLTGLSIESVVIIDSDYLNSPSIEIRLSGGRSLRISSSIEDYEIATLNIYVDDQYIISTGGGG